jgi:hypothetical protein
MPITLKIESGSKANASFLLGEGESLRVGRMDPANCTIPDDLSLSRVHFELECDGKCCRLRDLKSSNGTFLNGTAISESTLKNGDEIRAGQTRFSIQIGPDRPAPGAASVAVDPKPVDPKPTDPGSVDPELVQQRLIAALANNSQPQYAVVDGARDPAILRLLMHSGAQYHSLFQDQAIGPLALFAPYVVQLLPQSPLVPALLKAGWGKSWGICLSSKAAPSEVVAFLRRLLAARLPDGRIALFRFFDPRILRAFLPSCTAMQLRQIFGPIRYFMLEAEEPDKALAFSFKSRGLEKYVLPLAAPLPLSPTMIELDPFVLPRSHGSAAENPADILTLRDDQAALLEKAKQDTVTKTLLQQLRKLFPEECAALGPERMQDLVQYGSVRPQRYGICAHADIRSYIHLMMQLGRDFDTDPNLRWAADLLRRRRPPAERLAMLRDAAKHYLQPA